MTHILITDLREIRYMASNGESLPFDLVEDRIKIIGLISSTIRIPCSLLDLEPDLYQVPVEVDVFYYLPWRNEFVTTKDCVFNKSEATKVVARIVDKPSQTPALDKVFKTIPRGKYDQHYKGEPKEESQEEIWNDVDNNYIRWNDQEIKLPELLKDFEIIRRK